MIKEQHRVETRPLDKMLDTYISWFHDLNTKRKRIIIDFWLTQDHVSPNICYLLYINTAVLMKAVVLIFFFVYINLK